MSEIKIIEFILEKHTIKNKHLKRHIINIFIVNKTKNDYYEKSNK
jgi:hypothetical protein